MLKLKIVNSTTEDGIMSSDEKFYENLSLIERKNMFDESQKKFLKRIGLENCCIIIPEQKTIYQQQDQSFNYENGKYVVLTDELVNEYFSGNKEILHTDIVIMKSDNTNVILADKIADCPIIIIHVEEQDKQIIALAHCGAEYINRKLPEQMIESLKKETDIEVHNWNVYISACISKRSYTYDKYPLWATDKNVWKNYIERKNNEYYIDLRGAIIEQLLDNGVDFMKIKVDERDTQTNSLFYSHHAGKLIDPKKDGRFLVGAVFIDE